MTGLQIKRLQKLIGDPLLTKTASSVALTEIGKLVLDLARRKLSANDALRSLSGVAAQGEPVQVGMNSMLLDFFVNRRDHALSENLAVTSATCSVIMKAFNERQLDVAMVMDIKDHRSALGQNLIAEFEVDFAWIGNKRICRWCRTTDTSRGLARGSFLVSGRVVENRICLSAHIQQPGLFCKIGGGQIRHMLGGHPASGDRASLHRSG